MSLPGAGGAGTSPRTAAAALVAGLGIMLAACGGPASAPEAMPYTTPARVPSVVVVTTPTTVAPAPAGKSILPDLAIDDVAGGTVNLSSLVPAARPILLWFWAPT